jgi:hypothetical protein
MIAVRIVFGGSHLILPFTVIRHGPNSYRRPWIFLSELSHKKVGLIGGSAQARDLA